ncbi:MAG TPA: hypothetical protein VK358_02350 [Longimicrobium sp.]|nr:hypothetical protein [Longimicrobium sp.]
MIAAGSRAAKRAHQRAVRNAPLNARLAATTSARDDVAAANLRAYAEFPERYIIEQLGWVPWKGDGPSKPGQVEILNAYRDAVMQQIEMLQLLRGEISEADLRYYRPGMVIRNWIRVESGHGVGKTKIEAGIHSHFLDCFFQSIVYSYANTLTQLSAQLWKEIKADRKGKPHLPGRILETNEIKFSDPKHFSIGRATNAGRGAGTAKFQGQHSPFACFILDEAEEIPQQIYDSIDAMSTGGVVIVLLVANPQTRTSPFHRLRERADVINFTMSSLDHPNVSTGLDLVREAIRRDRVESYIAKLCHVVDVLDEEMFDFTLPWAARLPSRESPGETIVWPAGTIFRPQAEFLWRIRGIPPPDSMDNTLISVGRFEAAKERGRALRGPAAADRPVLPTTPDERVAQIGVDAARYGLDYGTIYVLQGARMWRADHIQGQNSDPYVRTLKSLILKMAELGVKRISLRVDGGGGYGSAVVDRIRADAELQSAFAKHQVVFTLHEVKFDRNAKSPARWADSVTELYEAAGDVLRGIAIVSPPEHLERDLTARRYAWRSHGISERQELESKDDFKRREHRSPDDGDGFVLAAAPERLVIVEGQQFYGSFSYLN